MAESNRSSARAVRTRSLRTTLFLNVFVLMTITVICVAAVTFFFGLHELNLRLSTTLRGAAQMKKAALELVVKNQREKIATVARNPTLQSMTAIGELVGFQSLLRVSGSGTDLLAGMEVIAFDPSAFAHIGGTVFKPIITREGWKQYVIASPEHIGERGSTTLVAVFDAANISDRIFVSETAGATAETLLGVIIDGRSVGLRFDPVVNHAVPVELSPDMLSIDAAESELREVRDYAGLPVWAATESIPTLGWTVIVKIDAYEAMSPAMRLAMRTVGIGLMIVVLLSLSMFFFARRIACPLEELAAKIDGLEAKRWSFRRTIATGNEIEVVDAATADLTKRLRDAHEHLEDLVRIRTEQVRSEHARDEAILRSMGEGLLLTDSAGVVTYMNTMASELIGTGAEIGKSVSEVLVLVSNNGTSIPRDAHPVLAAMRSRVRYAPVRDPQFSLRKRDGTLVALGMHATPVLRGKMCDGVVVVIRDITEERRVDTMKSEFISLVSHQLRTPISSMRWYLEMLVGDEGGVLSGDQKEWVGQATAANERMVRLVNALLNVSRMELGQFKLSKEPINLVETAGAAIANFEREIKSRGMTVKIDAKTGKTQVHSDRELLTMIIENLLGNALKYSPEHGEVELLVDEDEKHAIFSVQDHGIGITAAEQKNIGKRLFRADNAMKTNTDGNGLGLYISHLAAENIGASLIFTSTEGVGTTFTLRIPHTPKDFTPS